MFDWSDKWAMLRKAPGFMRRTYPDAYRDSIMAQYWVPSALYYRNGRSWIPVPAIWSLTDMPLRSRFHDFWGVVFPEGLE